VELDSEKPWTSKFYEQLNDRTIAHRIVASRLEIRAGRDDEKRLGALLFEKHQGLSRAPVFTNGLITSLQLGLRSHGNGEKPQELVRRCAESGDRSLPRAVQSGPIFPETFSKESGHPPKGAGFPTEQSDAALHRDLAREY